MAKGVCYTCLMHKEVFLDQHTNQLMCHDCFGKRHSKKTRSYKQIKEHKKNPTIQDLKEKWEL